MAKIYNQSLASADNITVKTYYKNRNCISNCNLNVYVTNIDDLMVEGTVNARIGEYDDYIDYKKSELFKYINGGMYSD